LTCLGLALPLCGPDWPYSPPTASSRSGHCVAA